MADSNTIRQRVDEARAVLGQLGFDAKRTNERSGLTLLAFLGLTPEMSWSDATNPRLGTKVVMEHMALHYDQHYAPNTRETIRKESIQQFVEAALVVENPDNPARPSNSPHWCYQISAPALQLLRTFEQPAFDRRLRAYLAKVPGLQAIYAKARELNQIPVTLPDGNAITLSPGGQNGLIKLKVEEFCSRFTPGGRVLYIGDADEKYAVFAEDEFRRLNIKLRKRGKMPDLVVHVPSRGWIVILEAVSSQGPVDAKRHGELSALFAGSTAELVYVSCFPSRAEMRRFLVQIAWETEVWCADSPTHLIHFNGERFLGPYA